MFKQLLTPVAASLPLSFLLAILPIAAVLVLPGVLRRPAWQASLGGLAAAFAIATLVWRFPLHLSPMLIAATNSSGGVTGKMISPRNIATGVAVTALEGQEGMVFARTFPHSVALTVLLGLLVLLQQYGVAWMIP